jgi:glycyl-tRNA synthetase beta subunit
VNAFFDKVLVNAEDPGIRANRHALLRQKLHPFLNQVADISKLAVEK